MNTKMIIEAIGYIGSALVVVSMLMTSVKKLRIVNTTGSVIFTVYALIIQSYPTALMNLALVCINVYRLYQLSRQEKHFALVKAKADVGMAEYLLGYYLDDIKDFFLDFSVESAAKYDRTYIVTCDAVPAGILIGNLKDDGSTLDVFIDYAIPTYRDCSVGEFLYRNLPKEGISKLTVNGDTHIVHESYLEKMGFKEVAGGFEKEL